MTELQKNMTENIVINKSQIMHRYTKIISEMATAAQHMVL